MHLRQQISGLTPELPLSSPVNVIWSQELVNILLNMEPNTSQAFRFLALMQMALVKFVLALSPGTHQASGIEGDLFFSVIVLSVSLLTFRHTKR